MGVGNGLEGLAGAFLEVTPAAAVAMEINASRHDVHAMGVDGLVHSVHLAAALAHLLDTAAFNDDRATIDPPLGGEHMTVVNLSEHEQSFLLLELQIYGVFL